MPDFDQQRCLDCGACRNACPFEPDNLKAWYAQFAEHGARTGLVGKQATVLAWNVDRPRRLRSPSGGVVTEILRALLETGKVSCVVVPESRSGSIGEPHSMVRVFRNSQALETARGSFYEPQCFAAALQDVERVGDRCALVGTPCVLKAIGQSRAGLRDAVPFRIGLSCSHCVSGQFTDCLASLQGVPRNQPFTANMRAKDPSMASANDFYNSFVTQDGQDYRQNRFRNRFTAMWRKYFFALECCLYCPDFFAPEADITAKDAWGKFSDDPLGRTMLIVRNPALMPLIDRLAGEKRIQSRPVTRTEIMRSQSHTPVFKQVYAVGRWQIRSDPSLREQLSPGIGESLSRFDHFRKLSSYVYCKWGAWPIHWLSFLGTSREASAPPQPITASRPRVVLAGGYGYGNAGDEAQLARCLEHWRNYMPEAEITVLSPNPRATADEHDIASMDASRNAWFGAGVTRHYIRSDLVFYFWFSWVVFNAYLRTTQALLERRFPRLRMLLNSIFLRAGTVSPCHELVSLLSEADVLHLVGGGYLSGMTASRLWDHMLLIRIASKLGARIVLSGQTIGPFKGFLHRHIANWGLRKAELIFLRDRGRSTAELRDAGIAGTHVQERFDDALFCASASEADVVDILEQNEVPLSRDYVVIHFHHWGQCSDNVNSVTARMAAICDWLVSEKGETLVMLPMHQTDRPPIQMLLMRMTEPASLLNYSYDFRIAKGIISRAKYCLTFKHHPIVFALGTGTPVAAVALDDYYLHKNSGALRLFCQEEWLLNSDTFWDTKLCADLLSKFIGSLNPLRKVIAGHRAELASIDGEVVLRTSLALWARNPAASVHKHRNNLSLALPGLGEYCREMLPLVGACRQLPPDLLGIVVDRALAVKGGWQVCLQMLDGGTLYVGSTSRERIVTTALQELLFGPWRRLSARNSSCGVAVFCAGKHTEWFLHRLEAESAPMPRVLVDERREGTIGDIPIVSPRDFLDRFADIGCVFVSSDSNEEEVFRRVETLFGDGLSIIAPYRLQWGPLLARLNPKTT